MPMEPSHNDTVRDILAGFDGVWKRVAGTRPPQGPPPPHGPRPAPPPKECPEPVPLGRLAGDAAGIAAYNSALARRFRGSARTMLSNRARQSRQMCSRLEAEIFLRCGERPWIKPRPPALPRDDLAALRASMQADEAAALSFGEAADREPDPELAALLRDFARRSRASAMETRTLIRRVYR